MKMLMLLVAMFDAETGATSPPEVELLDFTASYCQPCQQMVPILQRMQKDKFPVRQIDISEEPELARRFNVDRVPTLVLMVQGKEAKRFIGLTDEAELRDQMNRAARRLAETREPTKVAAAELPAGLAFNPGTDEAVAEPEATTETSSDSESKSSLKDVFRSLIGGNKKPAAMQFPTLRAQSPEADSRMDGLLTAEAATVRVKVAGVSSKDGKKIQDVGTGTIVYSAAGQAIILTCAHVFLDMSTKDAKIEIEVFENGKPLSYRASLIGGDHNSDLAFLKIQSTKIMPAVRLTAAAPSVGKDQSLVSFGCNGGADPTLLKTKIVDINRYNGPANLVCSVDPQSGRSGGGLFDANGSLVGVCSCADRKLKEGLYMAHAPIIELVNHLKLTSILATPAPTGGEDASSSFAAMLDGDAGASEKQPAPVKTPNEAIAELEEPAFDVTEDVLEEEATEPELVAADDEELGELTDAPLFNPKETSGKKDSRTAEVVSATTESGPEITIVIDDKKPGSQKRVIVIPQASAWMLELLTGESEDSISRASATAARPSTEATSKRTAAKSGKSKTSARSVLQTP
jgi:thiol-disulfide isomerase/thioredoxin